MTTLRSKPNSTKAQAFSKPKEAKAPAHHPAVKAFISKPRKMLIDNKWIDAASGKDVPVYDPASGQENRASGGRRQRSTSTRAVKASARRAVRLRPVAVR